MKLEWDESLKIGNEKIDSQHKELFEKINYFFNSMDNGLEMAEILGMLEFLDKHTNEHFSDEEEMQRSYNYPKYNEHCAQHQTFRNQLSDIRYMLNSYGVTGAINNYTKQKIIDFWEYHVNYLDRRLGEYIKEQSKINK